MALPLFLVCQFMMHNMICMSSQPGMKLEERRFAMKTSMLLCLITGSYNNSVEA